MMREGLNRRCLWVAVIGLSPIACSHDIIPTPSVPTASAVTVTTLAVSGLPPESFVGQTVQLSALASFSDSTQKDVTSESTWRSSDSAVATVSSTGGVSLTGVGEAEVTASYQGVTGRGRTAVRVAVPTPPGYVVEGTVHETPPTSDVVLPHVRIEVVGGLLSGRIFETDEAGRFALPPVESGDFYLYFKQGGYDDERFWVRLLPRDARIDVALSPSRRTHTRLTGGICNPTRPYYPPQPACSRYPLQVSRTVHVHRAGPIDLQLGWEYRGDYSKETMRLQIRCGSDLILERQFGQYQVPPATVIGPEHPATTLHATLPRECTYEIRLLDYSPDFKGQVDLPTTYTIDIDHPQ
jgi:hypothetical protein